MALPLDAINSESAREKSIRQGHPSTLHLWWARRPLAACRAILFAQLVDDPSAWPDVFTGEARQDDERGRLFRILEELVKWDNANNEIVLGAARLEIARSIARARVHAGSDEPDDRAILAEDVDARTVSAYLQRFGPAVHDPFSGGGSIPLEAQRLGLKSIATDLNPVPVLLSKALTEIPATFAGAPPVNPSAQARFTDAWPRAAGLARDVEHYGERLRSEALHRIGHLYGESPAAQVGSNDKVIAWIWARTVPSPDPACGGAVVPLLSSFWLSKRKGSEAWIEPVVDTRAGTWEFRVRTGLPPDPERVRRGTKVGRGDFVCILSDAPMPSAYVRSQAQSGNLGARLIVAVRVVNRKRTFESATPEMREMAEVAEPVDLVRTPLPKQALGFRVQNYGFRDFEDLFSPRQLVALTTLAGLVHEAREWVKSDAIESGLESGGKGLEEGGRGADAYADAVAVYLALGVSRLADMCNTFCSWENSRAQVRHLFTRHAIPMLWDYAEPNIFAGAGGDYGVSLRSIVKVIDWLQCSTGQATVAQWDAAEPRPTTREPIAVSTDPPYYDNVPYADLSDFFYPWLRRSLRPFLPILFRTVTVPKADELVAEPFRHGGRDGAESFFMDGMRRVLCNIRDEAHASNPITIYYAFKQSETREGATASTGWETFLEAIVSSGLAVVGTWPLRTELSNRIRGQGSNALASSIVLVCRERSAEAARVTRGDFRRALKGSLPLAIRNLQKGHVAPVDMAQACIGPGMAEFSAHEAVLESDGTLMTVRSALELINEVIDEVRGQGDSEFDRETRFALTWFETHGYESGPFGSAETLAKAANVSVSRVEEAGILRSAAGKVRLLRRAEMPDDWDPARDSTLTVWECAQHLTKRLAEGEEAAAALAHRMGAHAEHARALAYRLYTTCERRGWADEARDYNTLVVAWSELERVAKATISSGDDGVQGELF